MSNRCLVVIDMLFDFIDPEGALYCGETAARIVPRVRAIIDEFRASGDPVIYLTDAHDPDDRQFKLFGKHCVAGSAGAQIIEPLQPMPDEPVLGKKHFSGLYETRLEEMIVEKGCGEVHLTGVCTSICVMETAGDLIDRGYRVVVHADAVADFDQEEHERALRRMKRVFGIEVRGIDVRGEAEAREGAAPKAEPARRK